MKKTNKSFELMIAIDKAAENIVNLAKLNLITGTNKENNKDGKLYNSISRGKVIETATGYIVKFFMEDYGIFQDQGVKGTNSNYLENSKSPFSYKSKGGKFGLKGMPPPSAFDRWTITRGLAPRIEKGKAGAGQFLKRKTLDFLIARSIFKKGIRATQFFSKPFNKTQDMNIANFLNAYVKDIQNQIKN